MVFFTQCLSVSIPASCKFALPSKGRLSQPALQWLTATGINVSRNERELSCTAGSSKVFFARAADVPRLVESGAVDFGITGMDLLRESALQLYYCRLPFGNCRLSVAVPLQSNISSLSQLDGKVVATSFPWVTKYFFGDLGIDVSILELVGSVEAACELGLAQAIVDLVSTGETLRKNRLAELCVVLESQAVLCFKRGEFDAGRFFERARKKA